MLGMLVILFQEKKVSDQFILIYQQFLADLPVDVVAAAIKDCICECRFFPTIAEIRDRSKPHMEALRYQQRLIEQGNEEERQRKEREKENERQAAYQKHRIDGLIAKKEAGTATRSEIEMLEKLQHQEDENLVAGCVSGAFGAKP